MRLILGILLHMQQGTAFFLWRSLASRGLPLRLQKCQKWKDMKFLMLSLGAFFIRDPKLDPGGPDEGGLSTRRRLGQLRER